jgi:hypothetical protein
MQKDAELLKYIFFHLPFAFGYFTQLKKERHSKKANYFDNKLL